MTGERKTRKISRHAGEREAQNPALVPQPKSSKDSDEGTLRDEESDVADSGFIASTSDVGPRGEWERERDNT